MLLIYACVCVYVHVHIYIILIYIYAEMSNVLLLFVNLWLPGLQIKSQ